MNNYPILRYAQNEEQHKTRQNRSLYRLYFYAEGRGVLNIHGIEVIETFFECQSMSFCFNHLDNIENILKVSGGQLPQLVH